MDVCPTGIDIRNGTQLECVNCTACIDACDDIMQKVNKPKGLIRYASEKEIAEGKKPGFTPRIIAYTLVLIGILSFFFTVLFMRSDVETQILRTRGSVYQKVGPDSISNIYNISVINKTRKDNVIDVKLVNAKGNLVIVGGKLAVKPEGEAESILFIKMAHKDILTTKSDLVLSVLSGGKEIDRINVTFISDK